MRASGLDLDCRSGLAGSNVHHISREVEEMLGGSVVELKCGV